MTARLPRLLALLAALVLAAVAAAAEGEADKVIYPGTAGQAAPSGPGMAGGGALTVVAFLLLAGAGGWLLWRGRTKRVAGQEAPQLAIAETRSLGNRQYLVVASYEGKKFLLGVCPGRIDLLSPLDGTPPPRKSP
jgi:flagellar protein FliO/FliZ